MANYSSLPDSTLRSAMMHAASTPWCPEGDKAWVTDLILILARAWKDAPLECPVGQRDFWLLRLNGECSLGRGPGTEFQGNRARLMPNAMKRRKCVAASART